jgi:hypothetical protein
VGDVVSFVVTYQIIAVIFPYKGIWGNLVFSLDASIDLFLIDIIIKITEPDPGIF